MKKILLTLFAALTLTSCGDVPATDDATKTESELTTLTGVCPAWVNKRYLCNAPSMKSICYYKPDPLNAYVEPIVGCHYFTYRWNGPVAIFFNSTCSLNC